MTGRFGTERFARLHGLGLLTLGLCAACGRSESGGIVAAGAASSSDGAAGTGSGGSTEGEFGGRAGGPAGGAAGKEIIVGTSPGGGGPETPNADPPALMCSGGEELGAARLALLGRSEEGLVGVLVDGTRGVVLTGPSTNPYQARSRDGVVAIVEYGQRDGVTVLRMREGLVPELELTFSDPESLYPNGSSFEIGPDGSIVLGGRWDSLIRIAPDGSVVRRDGVAPEPSSPPSKTEEGYYVRGGADIEGWQIVSIPSNVVPLALAFYEPATGTLQTVRRRSDWIPTAASGGRIVYLTRLEQGVALVDEGVLDERTILLPGTNWSGSNPGAAGYGEQVRARYNNLPAARLDAASRTVTVLGELIALHDAGAQSTAGPLKLLVLDGVAAMAVNDATFADVGLSELALPTATEWATLGQDPVLVTADGAPVLWVDRALPPPEDEGVGEPATPVVQLLDRGVVLGDADPENPEETLLLGDVAFVVSGGVPRSRIRLEDAEVAPLSIALDPGQQATTIKVGDQGVLVTVNGAPRFVVDAQSGKVTELAPGPALTFDRTLTNAPWVVGLAGSDPVFRVNLATGVAERFAPADLPLPYDFYDPRWIGGGTSTWGCSSPMPSLSSEGNVLTSLRDTSVAGFYARASSDAGWIGLGFPITAVDWVAAEERPHAWVLRSGLEYPSYCTFPEVTWEAPPADSEPSWSVATQVVPRGDAPPLLIGGEARVTFHSSQTCALIEPSGNGDEPFVYDVVNGAMVELDGLSAITWLDASLP